MAKIEPGKGRATINQLAEGLEVIIPAKKNYLIMIFLSCWLAGWSVGEVSVLEEIFSSDHSADKGFMIVWIVMWTIGGGFAFVALLWNLKGKEIILINGIELKHVRDFILFRRSKEFDVAHIEDIRAQSNTMNSSFAMNSGMEFWGFVGGTITFDYGKSTHKIGSNLDEAEAKHIISKIKEQYSTF